MMTWKRLALAVVATGLTATVAHAQVNLTAETSSPGSSPHLSIVHLADILNRHGIASLQVQEGQTLTNSVVNVAEGRTDVTAVPLILHFLLEKGRGPFSKQGANGARLAAELRALHPYNAGAYGLFAHDSANIASWADIRGRTVFNGPPRGAALVNARQVIHANTGFRDGEDYRGLQANWGQLPNILVDGSAEAFVIPLTFPSGGVFVALAAGNVSIVSTPRPVFEGEAFRRLLRAPGNVPLQVRWEDMGYGPDHGVRLISEDGVFRGLGMAVADVVHRAMSADLARAITAAYIAAIDEMKAKVPYARNIGLAELDPVASGFCGPLSLKYHPGAVAAWEAAGYRVPDCAR